MANVLATQVTVDGPRNVVVKVDLDADTSDFSNTAILDPATLSATQPPTTQLDVEEIQYSITDGWFVTLWWDATSPKRMIDLAGRGTFMIGEPFGGLQNNAGSGKTGKILVSTTGYASGTLSASIELHCLKQTT